jgi:hypothetical protein
LIFSFEEAGGGDRGNNNDMEVGLEVGIRPWIGDGGRGWWWWWWWWVVWFFAGWVAGGVGGGGMSAGEGVRAIVWKQEGEGRQEEGRERAEGREER